ncbi:MAG TPA: low molecular weight protein-tyrosine-phosphatase [Burkholderiales bacterium]|jgi:protein-tyrosine phosphatase|nr:low molecular weight protein-tyrosine-phosphatase [Burkholderiales bacterium]
MSRERFGILFVCMGNICRSPMAEGVFRHQVKQAGLEGRIVIDSAGTHDYHVGEPPDPRAQRAAGRRGYDLSMLRGRQVSRADFGEFDYLLAMDRMNLRVLERLCPSRHGHKLKLFLAFSTDAVPREVPDPYYGGEQGFEQVLDLVEEAAQGLLDHLRGVLTP